jgi:hypothetical protein
MSGMTVEKWRHLREALERAEGLLDMLADIGSHAELEVVDTVVAAARRDLDRWQECDGFNCVDGQVGPPECKDAHAHDPCPDCGGSGVLPNQARLGAVFDAVHWVTWIEEKIDIKDAVTMRIAEAAVRAFDKETE